MLVEGANMPQAAVDLFIESNTAYGQAARRRSTAGNDAKRQYMLRWTFEEVDEKLKGIMRNIFKDAKRTAEEFGHPSNLVLGANVAGFRKRADAMIEQGVV